MKTKKQHIDLSIIVPVFNTEAYLSECIDSLLKQGKLRLEIILVNDGSTDRSGAIADQYAVQDNRIKVIHQENSGASAARNAGLKVAQGEYIAFVDSDDWVKENSFCELYNKAITCQVDIVMGNLLYLPPNGIMYNPYKSIPEETRNMLFFGKESFVRWSETQSYIPMAVNYVYRRRFLESIQAQFEEGIMYEDELWTPIVLCQARKVIAVDIDFYYYRQQEGSVMFTTKLIRRLDSLFRVTDRLMAFAAGFDFSGEGKELKSWLYVNIFKLYARTFNVLTHIKDTSYTLPEHHLACFLRDCRNMTPESQKICEKYFQQAERELKKYTDWCLSDGVATVENQMKAGKKLMLVYNILQDEDATLNSEDIPVDWFITTDRRYFQQADAVVFHIPSLYQVIEDELVKPKGQIWVSWYLESESENAWVKDPEIKDTFDHWICYRQDEDQKEHPLVCLCQKLKMMN